MNLSRIEPKVTSGGVRHVVRCVNSVGNSVVALVTTAMLVLVACGFSDGGDGSVAASAEGDDSLNVYRVVYQGVIKPKDIFEKPKFSLFVMNTDGSGQHPLPYWGICPAFSPDGKRLVFTVVPKPGQIVRPPKVFLAEIGSTEPPKEIFEHISEVGCSSWSPDGSRLGTGGGQSSPAFIYEIETGELSSILTDRISQGRFQWIPGEENFFLVGQFLHRISPASAASLTIEGVSGSISDLDVSHDGRRVVFAVEETKLKGTEWETKAAIYVGELDLAQGIVNIRQLAEKDEGFKRGLSWCPNDDQIIYAVQRRGNERGTTEYEFFIINIDGSNRRILDKVVYETASLDYLWTDCGQVGS